MNLISYRRSVVGWYNFDVAGVLRYNIEPETFRRITGVSEQAALGACEVTAEQLTELKAESKYIGLADGWEVVPSDDKIS